MRNTYAENIGKMLAVVALIGSSLLRVGPVYAQTATPTPTPFVYQASGVPFLYADYLNNASGNWSNPASALGLPNGVTANISAVGLPTYIALEELLEPYPGSYGILNAVKFDVIGANINNLVIYPQNNYADLCAGKQITTSGPTIGHNYVTFTTAECPALNPSYLLNHTFGFRFNYYFGNQQVTATIDAVGYVPIFQAGPYGVNVTNSTALAPSGSTPQLDYEGCSALDLWCNMRNWMVGTLNTIFRIDPTIAIDRYNTLLATVNTKFPYAYVTALATLDYGTAAPNDNIPDTLIPYEAKYKGNTVFQYDFSVSGASLDGMKSMLTPVRTMFTVLLWIAFIWFLLRFWPKLFG